MVATEQADEKAAKRMSSVLWDLFSGSAPYTNVFLRTLHPAYVASLAWNLAAGNVGHRDRRNEAEAGGQKA
jgi:hypothetical protein